MTIAVKDAAGATQTVKTLDDLAADGGQATVGAIADAAVTAGATGSLSAKLRAISRDIGSLVTGTVLAAGTALIGIVKIGNGTNTANVDTHGSVQTTVVDGSGNPVSFTSSQTADYSKSTGADPVMLPQDQVISVKASTVTNGTTKSRVVSAATTNATSVKTSAGKVMSVRLFNVAAYDVFFKFYDKSTAPTVGTDTPSWTIPIKAGTGYSDHFPIGDDFTTGIAYAITKLQADADTTAVAAGDVTGKIHWI